MEQDIGEAIEKEETAHEKAVDAEKASRAAQQSAADLSRTRSNEGGSVSSLRTVWDFRDLNKDVVDLEKLRPFIHVDAIEKAVRAYIKSGGRELQGVTIYEDRKVVVR
jgi:tryptophan 2,3-dioxygenase